MTTTAASFGDKCEKGKNQCGPKYVSGSTTVLDTSSDKDMCCYYVKNIDEPKTSTDKTKIGGVDYTYAQVRGYYLPTGAPSLTGSTWWPAKKGDEKWGCFAKGRAYTADTPISSNGAVGWDHWKDAKDQQFSAEAKVTSTTTYDLGFPKVNAYCKAEILKAGVLAVASLMLSSY